METPRRPSGSGARPGRDLDIWGSSGSARPCLAGAKPPAAPPTASSPVVGAVGERFGSDRLVVVRNGVANAEGAVGAAEVADPLEILPGAAIGTERTLDRGDRRPGQWGHVDLRWNSGGHGPGPIRRFVLPSLAVHGCPTLADYPPASVGSVSTPRPACSRSRGSRRVGTLEHAAPGTGQVGGDGRPRTAARAPSCACPTCASNRLPDVRPEGGEVGRARQLRLPLADVELQSLKDGASTGSSPASRARLGEVAEQCRWSRRSRMPSRAGCGRRRSRPAPAGRPAGRWPGWSAPTGSTATWRSRSARGIHRSSRVSFAAARPTSSGPARRQRSLPMRHRPRARCPRRRPRSSRADGALAPVWVGGVAVVDGYPNLMPSTTGDRFLEVVVRFGSPTAPFHLQPEQLAPPGTGRPVRSRRLRSCRAMIDARGRVGGGWFMHPLTLPPDDGLCDSGEARRRSSPRGRVTSPRGPPQGAPAQVTWVVARPH